MNVSLIDYYVHNTLLEKHRISWGCTFVEELNMEYKGCGQCTIDLDSFKEQGDV